MNFNFDISAMNPLSVLNGAGDFGAISPSLINSGIMSGVGGGLVVMFYFHCLNYSFLDPISPFPSLI